mgnify:CR=1 FL=1
MKRGTASARASPRGRPRPCLRAPRARHAGLCALALAHARSLLLLRLRLRLRLLLLLLPFFLLLLLLSSDVARAQIETNGFAWVRTGGGPQIEFGIGVASDPGTNAIVIGSYSNSVVFVSEQKVRRVSLEGGGAQTLFDLSALGAAWGGVVLAPDGSLLYTRAAGGGLAPGGAGEV